MSAFFCRKSAFFCKNGTFTQSNSLKAVRDFLVLFLVFVREKVTIAKNITFAESVSRIRPPDCSKLAKNPENDNGINVKFFDVVLFLLLSLVIGPSFMSI